MKTENKNVIENTDTYTARKISKYGLFSGPYFPVSGPEKTQYLDTFHEVMQLKMIIIPATKLKNKAT